MVQELVPAARQVVTTARVRLPGQVTPTNNSSSKQALEAEASASTGRAGGDAVQLPPINPTKAAPATGDQGRDLRPLGDVEGVALPEVRPRHVEATTALPRHNNSHQVTSPLPQLRAAPRLCASRDMPVWALQNPYILRGYRPINGSFWRCASSLLYVHNETGNIVSHALGVLVYLYLWPRTMLSLTGTGNKVFGVQVWGWLTQDLGSMAPLPDAALPDRLPLADLVILSAYFLSILTCLGTSTCFHLNCCHSRCIALRLNRLDYVGILSNIIGTFGTVIYFGFYANPGLVWLYNGIMLTVGLASVAVVLSKHATSPEYHAFRTLLFTFLGCFGAVPFLHSLSLYGGFAEADLRFNGSMVGFGGALYLIGALFYFYRMPERFVPGVFDYLGNSHQIFHLLVLAGCLSHYSAILSSMLYWHAATGITAT